MLFSLKLSRHQTALEEWFNSISHFVGAGLGIAALVILVIKSTLLGSPMMIVSSALYGTSLILMYTASGLYHIIPFFRLKKQLQIVDHCSIYILIAGSYTPFCLVSMQGSVGWALFGVIWGCAVLGIIFKVFYTGRFPKLSLMIYLIMGWLAIIAVDPLIHSLSIPGLLWLMGGGLFYSLGVLFFVLDEKYTFCHFFWHLFVLAGSILHFFAILFYVIQ